MCTSARHPVTSSEQFESHFVQHASSHLTPQHALQSKGKHTGNTYKSNLFAGTSHRLVLHLHCRSHSVIAGLPASRLEHIPPSKSYTHLDTSQFIYPPSKHHSIMCIAILTTAHPDYPFILLNNRDVPFHLPFQNIPPADHMTGIPSPPHRRSDVVALSRLPHSRRLRPPPPRPRHLARPDSPGPHRRADQLSRRG